MTALLLPPPDETQNGRQTWYFTPMQVHLRKQARADIILRADVKGMQLTLQHSKSPSATHTSYSLFLTNITVLHSHVEDPATISMSQNISHLKQSSQPEMIKILHDTWTVVDVTKYLQDWLFHGSDLWVEVITPHRLQENAKRGYPMLLFQPTVCVWDSYDDANISTSGNHLETALKGFLETSMQEKVARRLWSDSKQQGEDEKEAPRHIYKRAMHNTQCKVSGLQVCLLH